jgi:shikimate kinase
MCPIMSKRQKEEKVIEELEKEGNLKIESQGGGEVYEDERPRQGV